MALLKKLSFSAISSAAALLASVTLNINTAEAALFKFTFEAEGANGYFIYDDSAEKLEPLGSDFPLAEYDGSVEQYSINVGDIVAEGTKGSQQDIKDEARNIVYLSRAGNLGYDGAVDDFILYIPPAARGEEYGLSIRFSYPEGTFSDSVAIRTSVSDTATLKVYPYWDFPNTTGDYTFQGTVKTKIEQIPEPAPVSALLGVGAWFIFRRQRRQLLSAQD
ncbi:PEP-CTERM sorting domain-containing protein [Nostoc sp. UHCC 0252]|uniref:PEP-CTERM sorting domain-containing protein n=1 Tax=Nostoc sp. UHCC 0252 TaxID=3110241 RepID=UPI002B204C20|nr:PEP-CTERM sorting domain-containing protein [Nostoc sp. UHCC 0252]MEA5602793.1 PEP-CTERM sorting domain-containing protein [Nostoc sp. UHCC 0252]